VEFSYSLAGLIAGIIPGVGWVVSGALWAFDTEMVAYKTSNGWSDIYVDVVYYMLWIGWSGWTRWRWVSWGYYVPIPVYFEAGFYTNQVWSPWQYYWYPSWGYAYFPAIVYTSYILPPFDFWWYLHQNPWPRNY
jgi:hypothetical protein